jgi:hypothetical protein
VLSVAPQAVQTKATKPVPPPNGAISATDSIDLPHRLHDVRLVGCIVPPPLADAKNAAQRLMDLKTDTVARNKPVPP